MENRRVEQVFWGIGTSKRGEDMERVGRRVNVVDIFCTHVCKLKNETC
jgi:hypothetical protein